MNLDDQTCLLLWTTEATSLCPVLVVCWKRDGERGCIIPNSSFLSFIKIQLQKFLREPAGVVYSVASSYI